MRWKIRLEVEKDNRTLRIILDWRIKEAINPARGGDGWEEERGNKKKR